MTPLTRRHCYENVRYNGVTLATCKNEHQRVWFDGKECPVCLAAEVREVCARPVFAPPTGEFLAVRGMRGAA